MPTEATDLWNQTLDFLSAQGVDFLIKLAVALAIIVIGRWVARMLVRLTTRLMLKASVDDTLVKYLGKILYGILLVLVILAALDHLGIDTTTFAAVIAAAGLAIGFALQGSLSNFAAGMTLILFRPFKVGDLIEVGDVLGEVREIHLFSTHLLTLDNKQVVIPNGTITSDTIVNWWAEGTRRIDLVFGCGYEDDIKAVKALLEELVATDERILKDPPPDVAVGELGESSIDFIVRPWVKSEDYWNVMWDLTERVKLGFDERGFNIPYPNRDLHVYATPGFTQALAQPSN